jgi:ribosomal protein S18 acetylase RimI-like enzyme
MHITPATPADAAEIATLVNASYRGETARAGWANEAGLLDGQRTDPATLRRSLDGPATILLLRDAPDGPLAGCVSVEPAEGTTWYLGMLTIDPTRQADGLGRWLLAAGETFAQARGATRIRMTVIQLRDTLVAWYERRGYRLTGATQPFPYGDERFGVPLRDDLHFFVLEKALTD